MSLNKPGKMERKMWLMYYNVYVNLINVNSFSKLIEVIVRSGPILSLFVTIIRIVLNSVLQVLANHLVVAGDERIGKFIDSTHHFIDLRLREPWAHQICTHSGTNMSLLVTDFVREVVYWLIFLILCLLVLGLSNWTDRQIGSAKRSLNWRMLSHLLNILIDYAWPLV